MNKEVIQESIDKMKLEIANMEAKSKESDKVVLEYKDDCYIAYSYVVEKAVKLFDNDWLKHARYRDTKEQAEETLLRELQANRIEALARKLEPEWKADWNNIDENKYSIRFDNISHMYEVGTDSRDKWFGIPYMSEQTAETICSMLNDGRYSLDMED